VACYNRGRMRALFISAIAALLLVSPLVGQEGTGSLTGKVQDLTGAAIAQAWAELTSGNPPAVVSKTQADTFGVYRFTGLPAREYTLKLLSPGFQSLSVKSIQILDSERHSLPPIELEIGVCGFHATLDYLNELPQGGAGSMVGSVRLDKGPTARNNPPIADATVSLICGNSAVCGTTKTASNGEFIFRSIPPGAFSVRVQHAGFYTLEESSYVVQAGFEAMYRSTYMERCALGNCDPRRRPQKLALCE
jgi:hypothetical protein